MFLEMQPFLTLLFQTQSMFKQLCLLYTSKYIWVQLTFGLNVFCVWDINTSQGNSLDDWLYLNELITTSSVLP